MKNVVSDGKEKAQLVYDWAEQKDYLSPFVKEPRFRSNVVCTIDVDEKLPVDSLLKSFMRKVSFTELKLIENLEEINSE